MDANGETSPPTTHAAGPNGSAQDATTEPGPPRRRDRHDPLRLHPAAEAAVENLLEMIGEDPGRDGLKGTPKRVVNALLELTQGYEQDPAEILSTVFDEAHEDIVLVRDIPFHSLCEHHLLPIEGRATVAYLPRGGVVGLSKISRLVQAFARRLQVQERMTGQIARALDEHLGPRGVAVLIEAEHACMSMRGVQTPATMVTTEFLGAFTEPAERDRFLSHAHHGPNGGR